MAFIDPNAGSTNAPSTNTGNGQVKEKREAIAFINLYMPLANGKRIQLVGNLNLMLFAENANDAALVELVKSGKITAEQLASRIQVEFALARDKNEPILFDLGEFGTAPAPTAE